jgi:hypothetical protein
MFKARELTHTLEIGIEGTPEEFWQFFEFIKLKYIFKAAGSMPAVEKTSPYKEWHTPGNKRTVYFTTGDTATEEILECTVPNHFKYKVYNITLSARYFVKKLIGEWHITEDNGHTQITWQYQIFPKSVIHRLFILNFFKNSWIPYMELSLRLLQEQYDTHRHQHIQ